MATPLTRRRLELQQSYTAERCTRVLTKALTRLCIWSESWQLRLVTSCSSLAASTVEQLMVAAVGGLTPRSAHLTTHPASPQLTRRPAQACRQRAESPDNDGSDAWRPNTEPALQFASGSQSIWVPRLSLRAGARG